MTYHLSLIKVPVSNIKKALNFYEKHLDIKNVFFVEEYGWAQFDLDGIPFALYEVSKGGGERKLGGSIDFHLALDEDVFEERTKKWIESGILVDNQIHHGNDGTSFVDIIDLDYNQLKVMCIKKS